jgi:uncharacterized protein (TIGR00255 family)
MRSMTGFGRGVAAASGLEVTCEIKSVNLKGLDVRVRVDRDLGAVEPAVVAQARATVGRGRVEVTLSLDRAATARGELRFDRALADQMVDELHAFARDRGDLERHIPAAALLQRPELFVLSPPADEAERLAELVERATQEALADLVVARQVEGGGLAADLEARLLKCELALREIEQRADDAPVRLREKIEERLQAAGASDVVEPDRLAQEVALLADKVDVSEEIARVRLHVSHFRDLARASEPIGRKLDFLCQELNREANTVGSKCNDAETAHHVVELKAQIERIREQVQNVE